MKTTSQSFHRFVLGALVAAFVFAGAANLMADNTWDARHHYRRDNYGYYDHGNHYHHYTYWHNHHGYWDTTGPRVFINVD
jgi:hypothetical protein